MLDIAILDRATNQLTEAMPWVSGINSEDQELLATLEVLIKDYDAHRAVINLTFPVSERYEAEAKRSSLSLVSQSCESSLTNTN